MDGQELTQADPTPSTAPATGFFTGDYDDAIRSLDAGTHPSDSRVVELQRALTSAHELSLKECHLLSVLYLFANADFLVKATQGWLTKHAAINKTDAAAMLKALEEKGYIELLIENRRERVIVLAQHLDVREKPEGWTPPVFRRRRSGSERAEAVATGHLIVEGRRTLRERRDEGEDLAASLKLAPVKKRAPKPKVVRTQEELEAELTEIKSRLWWPEIVEKAIGQATQRIARDGGKPLTLTERLRDFYRPVADLQEAYPLLAPVVQTALKKTLEQGIAARHGRTARYNNRWHRYATAIIEKEAKRYKQTADKDVAGAHAELRRWLDKASALNNSTDELERDEARYLLPKLRSYANRVAPLIGGDSELAEAAISQAFKEGVEDWLEVARRGADENAPDFLDDWTWPSTIAQRAE